MLASRLSRNTYISVSVGWSGHGYDNARDPLTVHSAIIKNWFRNGILSNILIYGQILEKF